LLPHQLLLLHHLQRQLLLHLQQVAGTIITMPALGESVSEGTVTRWLKGVGDSIAVDEAFSKFQQTKLIPKFLHLLPEQLFQSMFQLIQLFQLERVWRLLAVRVRLLLLHQLQLPLLHQLQRQ
jgi:hypothetical protein